MEFAIIRLGKIQDQIKNLTLLIKQKSKHKSTTMNASQFQKLKKVNILDYHQPDKEFNDKSDKLRDTAKSFYEKSGAKIDERKIRDYVSPVIFNEGSEPIKLKNKNTTG